MRMSWYMLVQNPGLSVGASGMARLPGMPDQRQTNSLMVVGSNQDAFAPRCSIDQVGQTPGRFFHICALHCVPSWTFVSSVAV